MKIISNTSVLSAIIAKVSKACSRNKAGLTILQYILFAKKDDEFYLIASNEDVFVQYRIEFAQVEGEWHDFCLKLGSVTSSIAMLPDQPIAIEVSDEAEQDSYAIKFTITGANGKETVFDSVALSSIEYPSRSVDKDVTSICLETKALLACIKEASKYVAKDLLRPVMNGVYLAFEKDQLTVVASNGHYLYYNKIKSEVLGLKDDQQASVDIPVAIEPILSSCAASAEEMKVGISDKSVYFLTSDMMLISTIYDGRYPNYKSVIPKNNREVVFNKRELVTSTRLVHNFAPTETDILCMEFGESLFMDLSTSDVDFATSAKDSVTIVDSKNVSKMRIGMRGSSLLTCLSDIQTENVKIKFEDSLHAITIHEDDEESNLLILLMPMQLND